MQRGFTAGKFLEDADARDFTAPMLSNTLGDKGLPGSGGVPGIPTQVQY